MEKEYTPEQMVIIDSQAQKAAAAVKDLIEALGLLKADGRVPVGSDLQIVTTYFNLLDIANQTFSFSKMKAAEYINLKM